MDRRRGGLNNLNNSKNSKPGNDHRQVTQGNAYSNKNSNNSSPNTYINKQGSFSYNSNYNGNVKRSYPQTNNGNTYYNSQYKSNNTSRINDYNSKYTAGHSSYNSKYTDINSEYNKYNGYSTHNSYPKGSTSNSNNRRASYNTLDAQSKFNPIRNIGESNKKSQKPRKKFSSIEKLILLACGIVFMISFSLIAKYVINGIKQDNALRKIQQIKDRSFNAVISASPTMTPLPTPYDDKSTIAPTKVVTTAIPMPTAPPKNEGGAPSNTERTIAREYKSNKNFRIRDKFFSLLDVNEDIAGWIKIGNFLNQPVMKKDNSYYLKRNFLKEDNPAGAIFLDESTDFKYPPENLIFHGHNMKDGSMFGKLIHYKTDEGTKFYIENPIISFDSLYEDARYIIFAVCEVETDYTHPNYFPFIAYSRFNTDADAYDYINNIKSRSIINVPIDIKPTDNLITLATCSQTSESTRLLVVGRKIRSDESEQKIRDAIYYATRIKK